MIMTGIARFGKAPKMSYKPNGSAQTHLSLAFTCGFGDKQETVWVGAWAYGKQAEFINQYFDKGSRIDVSLEVTGLYTYAKDDGLTDGMVNARVLTAGFVDKADPKSAPKGKAKTEPTPFDEDVVELEDF